MTDRTQDQAMTPPSSAASAGAHRWVVPAALFAAGLVLGGGAVALITADDSGSDQVAAVASPSPSPEPSPSPADPADLAIRIPAPCVQVAKEADAAFQDVDELAEAVRGFDARALQQFLERFQQVRPRIEALSQECQDRAASGVVEGDLVAPTPAPDSAPSSAAPSSPTAPSPAAS